MSLQDNTIAYQVSFHRWGIERKIKPGILSSLLPEERNLVESKMLSASKKIIQSDEYNKIVSKDGFAARWLADHSVPSILKKGVYLIPVSFVDMVNEYMEAYKTERQDVLVPAFLEVYFDQAYTAREMFYLTTGGSQLFDALEYPTVEKMATLFSVETAYISFDVPSQLQHISEELFRRERERVEQAWNQAEDAINQLLVQECAELVQGLQTALKGLNDGTLKKFRDANVENLREWSALFLQARNVTNNEELENVVRNIQATLQGVERDDLKHDRSSLRQYVQSALSQAQIELKGMVENAPERLIQFE